METPPAADPRKEMQPVGLYLFVIQLGTTTGAVVHIQRYRASPLGHRQKSLLLSGQIQNGGKINGH